MKRKITAYFLTLIFVTAILVGFSSYLITDRYYTNQIEENMLMNVSLFEQDSLFKKGDYEELAKKYASVLKARITLISTNGTVLYDSYGKITESHSNRPEFVEAKKNGTAFLERHSETTKENMYYAAKLTADGTVIRFSKAKIHVDETLWQILFAICLSILLCVTAAFVLSFWFSHSMIRPLSKLKEHMRKNTGSPAISPLDTEGLHAEVLELACAYNDLIAKLNYQMEEIEKLQNMRSDFVANVSHELKTPLTSIRGFVETLKNGAIYKEDVAMRFLNIIDIEATRLQNLISDTLFLSKIEKMDMDKDTELFSLTDLTTEIIELMLPQVTERNITITFSPDREVWMQADASKIKQLLLNLLSNAIKYNKDGGKIRVQENRVDKRHVTISVSDNGIGMDQENLERIFERFYCVDKGRSQKNGGTGLGLSIVKHIANLYAGQVNVESEVGKGSAFTVTLCVDGDEKKED